MSFVSRGFRGRRDDSRFTLRHFFRWLSRRSGVRDPFLELAAPKKPQQEADWLTVPPA